MGNRRWTEGLWLVVALAALVALPAACGSSHAEPSGTHVTTSVTSSTSGGPGGGSGLGGGVSTGELASISVDPPTAIIVSANGMSASQSFSATAHMKDGSTQPITAASWTATSPQVGAVAATGLFTASGSIGGVVPVTATFMGLTATAMLTVDLQVSSNTAGATNDVQTALQGATTPDAAVVWAYPYNGTVWPRGLLPPILQWNGGADGDVYWIHFTSATFDLQDYVNATSSPSSQISLDPTEWQQLVDSTSGAIQLKVARWDGTNATVIADHTWTIAPASMRGTIYYWSNDLGRVLRIKPGAAMADDFANQAPLNDPTQYVQSSCLMTCHSVSADGSTLVSGGGTFGGSYNLKAGMPMVSLPGTWGGPNGNSPSVVQWAFPAVSPTGKYILTNAMAERLTLDTDGVTTGFLGLYTTADGMPVPSSGLMGVPLTQPAWSPDGSRIAFVDPGDPTTWAPGWNNPPPGDLKVYAFDETKSPMISNEQTLVAGGADPNKSIAWPTVSPDGRWVVYSRTPGADTRTGNADLYMASAVTPNQEVRLAGVDGDNYPFAAGARDLSWNFEPSFAPVAAGGYFWVVFTSRRTYGNVLTGDKTVVKQLWVTAINQNPTPGVDPSHPAFHLTGQVETSLAMRGFWALDPCKSDGTSCTSGTECCGGFCNPTNANVCSSTKGGCSQDGDKCDAAADCCNVGQGATCINHVCSEAPPK